MPGCGVEGPPAADASARLHACWLWRRLLPRSHDASGPAVEALAGCGRPAYLIFETLAERTLALAQLDRRQIPAAGYTPYLADFLRPILRRCGEARIRIVANFGAANPMVAGRRMLAVAEELGLPRGTG